MLLNGAAASALVPVASRAIRASTPSIRSTALLASRKYWILAPMIFPNTSASGLGLSAVAFFSESNSIVGRPGCVAAIRALKKSSSTSWVPSGLACNTVWPKDSPIVISVFIGAGWPGIAVSIFIFMSITCTTRSCNGHFNFNSIGPVGVLNSDFLPSLPDLLQPTQARLTASMVAIRTKFLFMADFMARSFWLFNQPRLQAENFPPGFVIFHQRLSEEGWLFFFCRLLSHAGTVMSIASASVFAGTKSEKPVGLGFQHRRGGRFVVTRC